MAVDAAPRDDFKQKLLLSIIDKLVFGLLIILAGFVLNWVLESHRADEAMKTEIARLRVQNVAEMWQALDRHQRAINGLGRVQAQQAHSFLSVGIEMVKHPLVMTPTSWDQLPSQGLLEVGFRRSAALVKERERLTERLQANRFWLGERIYPQYVSYIAKQERLAQAYADLYYTMRKALLFDDAAIDVDSARQARRWRTQANAAYENGLQDVNRRRRELNEARIDVFSAMERLS